MPKHILNLKNQRNPRQKKPAGKHHFIQRFFICEVITATFKVVSSTTKLLLATNKLILSTEEVITTTLKLISTTIKVILATEEVITGYFSYYKVT